MQMAQKFEHDIEHLDDTSHFLIVMSNFVRVWDMAAFAGHFPYKGEAKDCEIDHRPPRRVHLAWSFRLACAEKMTANSAAEVMGSGIQKIA